MSRFLPSELVSFQALATDKEIGVMQELEKHNLARITNVLADFLIQF